ncbi:hypothetical protein EUX98_g3352 [Antrodiella citrinella]|uniref:Uncharacterized protein n=1 Tax=Antrodiella citrinella TaxID=2447956 RepID=A0A4S4MZ92_9APHY|nr:hypothetical protein EUX98_g3352 [Antrodiella citrinella]
MVMHATINVSAVSLVYVVIFLFLLATLLLVLGYADAPFLQDPIYWKWTEKVGVQFWHLPVWTLAEIKRLQAAFRLEDTASWIRSPDQYYTPEEIFHLLGPSARTCFCSEIHKTSNPEVDLAPLAWGLDDIVIYINDNCITLSGDLQSDFPKNFHHFFYALPPQQNPTTSSTVSYDIPTLYLRMTVMRAFRRHPSARLRQLNAMLRRTSVTNSA